MRETTSPAAPLVPSVLLGVLSLGVFLVWAAVDGGYPTVIWNPGAAVFACLLALLVAAAPQLLRTLPPTARAAAGLLAAFAVWNALSIAWAGDKGEAWDGANRTILYAVVYAVFLLWPWRARHGASLLGAYALGVAAVAAATYLAAARSGDPYEFFVAGRYVEPVGYVNANCALFLSAFFPAVFLASRRETPWWLRGLFLATAGFLLEQAVLPQSRGSLFAFPLVVVLYLAVVPGRARSLLALVPACAAAFVVREPLLDVYAAVSDETLPEALVGLEEPLLGSGLALFLLGTVYGIVDRYAPLRADLARLGSWLLGAATAFVAAAAVVATLVAYGNPVARAQDAWDQFSGGHRFEESASYFGTNLGSNRYDFWRVALEEWRDAPMTGIGAGNFATPYVRERESVEEPLYPHSLPVMVVSQTGIVGGLLFVGFLGSALAAVWSGRRTRSQRANAVAAAATVAAAYFVVHGTVDWFWEFPGLAAPAFAWLGLAGGLERPPTRGGSTTRWTPPRWAASVAGGLVLLAVLASFLLPWLSAREIERAVDVWRAEPERAYAALDRARTVNPLSARADLVAGAVAMRRGDWDRAEQAFTRALERHSDNWYAELELALLAALDGRREDALARLARARELNPREDTIALVREQVAAGEPVDPRTVDRIFVQRVEERTS